MTKEQLVIEVTRLKMAFQKNAMLKFQDLHKTLDLIQGVGMEAISINESNSVGSLVSEEINYTGSQVFTTANYFAQIYSIEVTGVGAMSKSQYTIISNNQFVIHDQLESGDFIVVIYSKGATQGTLPYYTQVEIDLLLINKEDKSNKGIADGYASLDNTGKVPLSQLPPLAPEVPDATTTTKGIIKLAGDLGGTADAPTVPGLSDKASLSIVTNIQAGTTYTLVSSDLGKQIIFTNASAITVTIPSALPSGFNCEVLQEGTGQVSFITSATTLRMNSFESPSIVERWGVVAIDNIPNVIEEYHLYGDLTAI